MPFDGYCQRCGAPCHVHTMSWFNTQEICLSCAESEKKDSHYAEAKQAEAAACRRGDFNFPGIGLPTTISGGASHRSGRCGKCKNCLELERVRKRVLACCNPPFSHADDGVVNLWNTELARLPCTSQPRSER